MLAVLEITLPIYLLIGIGFVLTRRGVFSEAEIRALSRFILSLSLPALMFSAVTAQSLSETVKLPYIAIYGIGGLAMIAGLYPVFRRVGGYDHVTTTLALMGSVCPNSGYVGYPILLLAMPEVAGRALAQNVLVELLLIIPLLLAMLEVGEGDSASPWRAARRIGRRVVTNPLVLAILAGLTVSGLGLRLPSVLERPIDMLAAASGAISLVVIGGMLAQTRPRGVRALAGYIVLAKLVLHPLVMLAGIALFALAGLSDLPPDMRTALIVTAAVPTMGIFPVLAHAHGRAGFASAAQFGATVASLFTLSALLLLLR
ncbi:AEC family transporter [Tropicimonas sp. IMCC6043]|uniref:AEC family transporter n=1 Tax=Tropicimonas sp. IMCC6043 TaxID=2510645 RepID=UPI00101B72FE|nr:AEC family transporter [Tropicimonas sp. IMCC6043]RYH09946.1 AEC family transporter [Tropicimonas sp. IMCC6043]